MSPLRTHLAFLVTLIVLTCRSPILIHADDSTVGSQRLRAHQLQFELSHTPPGLLVPLYVYPTDVANNPHWNRLIELKRTFPQVPVIAIVNPASGPGKQVDANYQLGVRRLHSAGVVMIGYVSTDYAKIPAATVQAEIDRWETLYPLVQGIFLDESTSEPGEGRVEHYVTLTRHAHEQGYWPVFANPGTLIHDDYFAAKAADVFVIHETEKMPTDDVLSRLEESPCTELGILVYGQKKYDPERMQRLSKYARWLYVTEDVLPNPWDVLSAHSEEMFDTLVP